MANLRDIINAATPGPWAKKGAKHISVVKQYPEEWRGHPYYIHKSSQVVSIISALASWGCPDKQAEANRDHIAAYSPDHTLLIEGALEAVLDLVKCPICASRGADGGHASMCPLGHVAAYRKAHGYDA